jgi:hypothetical protein
MNIRTQNGRSILCSIACTLLVIALARVVTAAPCQVGCTNASCFWIHPGCLHYALNVCVSANTWANPDLGAVAAASCTQVPMVPKVSEEVVDSCSQECANNTSRALNQEGKSTCGDVISARDVVMRLCEYPD